MSEFQKLWRSVPVDSIDEDKIEEYLKKQGISSMQETGPKKVVSVFFCIHTYICVCVCERDLLERNKKVFNMQFLWLHLFKEMNES